MDIEKGKVLFNEAVGKKVKVKGIEDDRVEQQTLAQRITIVTDKKYLAEV